MPEVEKNIIPSMAEFKKPYEPKRPLAESNRNNNTNKIEDRKLQKNNKAVSQESLKSLGTDSVTTRNHLGKYEKEWFCSAMKGDIPDIKDKLQQRPDLLEHNDYILGVSFYAFLLDFNSKLCTV